MVGAVRATATFAVGILRLIGTYRSGYTRAKVSWSGVPWTLTAPAFAAALKRIQQIDKGQSTGSALRVMLIRIYGDALKVSQFNQG